MYKPVVGFEMLYDINEEGTVVRYLKNGNCKPLNPKQNKVGYPIVALSKSGKSRWYLVHRLVAEAFVPNPDKLPIVDHIDEDKTNCSASNLRWCTVQQNVEYYCTKDGRRHNIELGKKRKTQLREYEAKLRAVRLELTAKEKLLTQYKTKLGKLEAELGKKEEKLLQVETAIKQYAQKTATKPKAYEGYLDTKGVKFTSVEDMIGVTGKPITINGVVYPSTKAATSYIVEQELLKGVVRNYETVRKELRRYLQGLRGAFTMYTRYRIE